MMTVWHRLSVDEMGAARAVAVRRLDDALRLRMRDRFGQDSLESHYWGASGELLVARHLGLPWRGGSREGAIADVGRYEVRAIPPWTSAYIKAKRNDPPDRPIALVLFAMVGVASLPGWTTVSTVRRFGIWDDIGMRGAPAWFLRDLSHLDPIFPELVAA